MCEHCGCGDTATKHRLMDDPNGLLTINEFCDWTKVHRNTWHVWCRDGTAPRHTKIGGAVRIKVSDALTWLDNQFTV